MSGSHFHVHGPHDHELEHAAQHGTQDAVSGRIAVTTAVLATVGALFSYQGGATQADATLFKNNAAISKTEAANQWNYYQAKSSKQNLAELAVEIAPPERRDAYRAQVQRYEGEKADIRKQAERFEAESKDWDRRSDAALHLHHRWAQATTVIQISIALSAIALLTRRTWLLRGVYGVAAAGLVIGALAAAHV
ncbi:MAG: hypothetical protein RJA99_521 [Pseudomonadota bacterium]|jgi:hypothetical protein